MAVNPSPLGPKPQFELSDGTPAVGYKLFFYVAGSTSTKQNTYTDSTGGRQCESGCPEYARSADDAALVYRGADLQSSLAPDTDTDPPTSPVWTIDNLAGINDVAVSQAAEWVAGPTPTYVSATSFTLLATRPRRLPRVAGSRRPIQAGRSIRPSRTTAFGAVTTVTVANDSGSFDAGLSAVSYGLLSAVNPIIDADMVHRKGTAVASAATTDIWGIAGDFVHVTGVVTITSLGTAPYAGAERTVIFDGALVLTQNALR
jgi:hypothetical protein